ncbi:MAG: SCO family protein [Sediminibacterium sp.]|nr:SCO family protein [Sediminibacterium sp.]
MKKRNWVVFLLVIFLPFFCYFFLKITSQRALVMPRHYIYDSLVENDINGRIEIDTVWHTLSNLKMVNQFNDSVSLWQLKGKIIVLDYFFTRCAGICPKLTKNMQQLQQSFKIGGQHRFKLDTSVVQFISLSVDPDYDQSTILREYAKRFEIVNDNWWLCTGNKKALYDFAFEDLKVDRFTDEAISPEFVHTNRFVLIDKNFNIRGYYNGLDKESIKKLAGDIGLLVLEKGTKKSNSLIEKYAEIKWVLLLAVIWIVLFIFILRKFK